MRASERRRPTAKDIYEDQVEHGFDEDARKAEVNALAKRLVKTVGLAPEAALRAADNQVGRKAAKHGRRSVSLDKNRAAHSTLWHRGIRPPNSDNEEVDKNRVRNVHKQFR